MQPILINEETQRNGHVDGLLKHEESNNEKVVLPVEMACMVPLRTLIGKLVHKAHADLMTLVDT